MPLRQVQRLGNCERGRGVLLRAPVLSCLITTGGHLEGPSFCRSGVSSDKVLVQAGVTPKASSESQCGSFAASASKTGSLLGSLPGLPSTRSWMGKMRRCGPTSGSEALIGMAEAHRNPTFLEELCPLRAFPRVGGCSGTPGTTLGGHVPDQRLGTRKWEQGLPDSRDECLSGQDCPVASGRFRRDLSLPKPR